MWRELIEYNFPLARPLGVNTVKEHAPFYSRLIFPTEKGSGYLKALRESDCNF